MSMFRNLIIIFLLFCDKAPAAEPKGFESQKPPQTSTHISVKDIKPPVIDLKKFPEAFAVEKKGSEIYTPGELGRGFFDFGKVYLIVKKDEKGFLRPTGRAVALDQVKKDGKNMIKLICYKFINNLSPSVKDSIVYLGSPMDEAEEGDIKHILLSKLNLDRELEDMYHGVMAFRTMLGKNSLGGSARGAAGTYYDVNSFKKTSESFPMYGFGYTWWFFFMPQAGFDVEYKRGSSIHIDSYKDGTKSAYLSNLALSLMFRMRLFKLPAMVHARYFVDRFKTDNVDDFIISSKYKGLAFFAQWYFPYKFQIFRLWSLKMVFQSIEAGLGFSPVITVKDDDFTRGSSNTGRSFRYHGGLFFNFESSETDIIKDVFFGLILDATSYSFKFSGPTKGTIPGEPLVEIPQGGSNTERYFYWGFVIKYVFSDPFEDF